MTVVGLLGDHTTTTAMALAVSWPGTRPVTLIEADPTGGSLIGWLDDPSTLGRGRPRRGAEARRGPDTPIDVGPINVGPIAVGTVDIRPVDDFLRDLARNGGPDVSRVMEDVMEDDDEVSTCDDRVGQFDVVTAPVHPLEAERAVSRLPVAAPLSAQHPDWKAWSAERVCLVDLGARPHRPLEGVDPLALDLLVLVVAQRSASEGAAAVHIGRMTGVADQLRARGDVRLPVVVLVIGDRPFDPFDVGGHLRSRLGVTGDDASDGSGSPARGAGVLVLPSDPLAAAVLAGRAGMSARRWSRTRLGRAASVVSLELAEMTRGALDPHVPDADSPNQSTPDHHVETVGGRQP